jgi:bacteriocin biosynthesis cyclodehydratase domain-containing protein
MCWLSVVFRKNCRLLVWASPSGAPRKPSKVNRNATDIFSLPRRPKIRSSFAIIFTDADCCQLRAGNDIVLVLRGRTVSDVLPVLFNHLDGSLSVAELAEVCKEIVTEEDLREILKTLKAEGVLEDAYIDLPLPVTTDELEFYAEQLSFLAHFEREKYESQRRLKGARVAVVGGGSLGSAVLCSLASMGVGHLALIDTPGGAAQMIPRPPMTGDGSATAVSWLANINPHVHVETLSAASFWNEDAVRGFHVIAVTTDRPEFSVYEEMNRASLRHGIPWITCSPLNSVEGAVGPFFVPFETCCYRCYDLRVKSNIAGYSEYIAFEAYALKRNGRVPEYGYLPAFPNVLGNLAALELVKHLTGFIPPETYGRVLSINFITLHTQIHEVLKLPRCPDCGPPSHLPPIALWSK